jgi:hypothetical protein
LLAGRQLAAPELTGPLGVGISPFANVAESYVIDWANFRIRRRDVKRVSWFPQLRGRISRVPELLAGCQNCH